MRREKVENTWEETAILLHKTSNVGANYILLSVFSGVLATIGLARNNVFSLIAGMLLLPGFQPIANIPLGIVLRRRNLVWLGVKATSVGYGVFALGAVATYYLLVAAGDTSMDRFTDTHLVNFWAAINIAVLINALIASAAGVTIMATHQSVLTAGAMIALGLVPGLAIFVIALTLGEWHYMWHGLLRWLLDAGAVIVMGGLVFWLKQIFMHKRGLWY